jgi:hypothetical protein
MYDVPFQSRKSTGQETSVQQVARLMIFVPEDLYTYGLHAAISLKMATFIHQEVWKYKREARRDEGSGKSKHILSFDCHVTKLNNVLT